MKGLPKKLLPLTVFAIVVTSLFSVQPAQAYKVTLREVGTNVVAHGSGAINLTGLFLSVMWTITEFSVLDGCSLPLHCSVLLSQPR
jgi:hypothetical protein